MLGMPIPKGHKVQAHRSNRDDRVPFQMPPNSHREWDMLINGPVELHPSDLSELWDLDPNAMCHQTTWEIYTIDHQILGVD